MSKTSTPPTFEDFKALYIKSIEPLKKANPDYIRLDGKIDSGTRTPFAYFYYQGKKWKVDADTCFDKLKIAFDALCKNKDPFIIRPTNGNKGKCLVINGQPLYRKKFYVYLIAE